jgi:tyrosine-protein phosphatase YwqE
MATAAIPRWRFRTFRSASESDRQLGVDFHCHLLPEVDDGAANMTESVAAITTLQAAGFRGAVVTPHIYHGVYNNSKEGLVKKFHEFQEILTTVVKNFSVHLAAEYFTDEYFLDLIQRDEILSLTVGQERWVLIEFPYHYDSPYSTICMSTLSARGYRPVIAHVERYNYVAQGRTVWLSRFARAGAILQCNLGSLAGQHGQRAKRFSEWLLAESQVGLWGSDLHKSVQMEMYVLPGLRRLGGAGMLNAMLAAV